MEAISALAFLLSSPNLANASWTIRCYILSTALA